MRIDLNEDFGVPYHLEIEDIPNLQEYHKHSVAWNQYNASEAKRRVKQKYYLRQKGKCAICSDKLPEVNKANLDHCHTTGKYRGLLCMGCNVGLGCFKDNTHSLEKSIDYLRST